MSRPKQLAITERQFEVLNLLWEHGPQTVREIKDRLQREGDLPYTTVLGLLQIMEQADLVTHDVESKTYRYRPLITRKQGTNRLLSDFVQRFFRGAAENLVLGLIETRQLSIDDLHKLETDFAESATPEITTSKKATPVAKSKRSKRGNGKK